MHQIVSTVFDRATRTPDDPALIFLDITISHRQLADRAQRMASGLLSIGITSGDRVALLSRNHPAWFDALIGTALIGATFVPINWRLERVEVGTILDDSNPGLVIVEDSLTDKLDPRPADGRATVVIGAGEGERPDYERWLAGQPPAELGAAAPGDHPVLLLYTSGTTGKPKGVMVSATAVGASCRMQGAALRFHDQVTSLVAMPLFHLGGFGYTAIGLSTGAVTVLHPEVDPVRMLRDVQRHRVTHMLGIPAVLAMLLDCPTLAQVDLSSLEVTAYGASPIPEKVLLRALGAFPGGLAQVYGSTETGAALTVLSPEDHRRTGLTRSAGRALPDVQVKIVEPLSEDPLDAGLDGEILARTPALMSGYWNKPSETEAALTADGWYRTGDVGHLDAEGYLHVTDRIDDMIISGGENVFPGEVERVLLTDPAIGEAAVVGCPDDRWGQAVTAAVTASPGYEVEPDEVIAFTRRHLAHYKCPVAVHVLDELPRNAAGKIMRRDLRARLVSR